MISTGASDCPRYKTHQVNLGYNISNLLGSVSLKKRCQRSPPQSRVPACRHFTRRHLYSVSLTAQRNSGPFRLNPTLNVEFHLAENMWAQDCSGSTALAV